MNVVSINKTSNRTNVDISNFTDDQIKAYDSLLEFINSDYKEDDYKRALIGFAGTGKTYLIRALIKNSNASYSTIGLSAPTHKACRVLAESINISNIRINTLQSDLGLRLNFNVEKFDISNPPFDPKGRIKIGEYKVYIVDEASMIPKGLCMFLEKTCKTNKCKLIYIGDDAQLAPAREYYSAALRNIKSHFLTEIIRQDDTNPVRKLLELLRYDIKHKSFTFLEYISSHKEEFDENNTQGFKVCNKKEFDSYVYTNFNDETLTRNVDFVKIICYTNLAVSGWNKLIRNAIIANAESSIITKNDLIISYVTIVDRFNDTIIKNSEEYIIHDIVNYTHPRYELKGFLVRFQAIYGGKITSPIFILDHTDTYTIKKYVQISNHMIELAKNSSVKLKPQHWKNYYDFKESCLILIDIINKQGKKLYTRDLDYGFSLTAHKS